MEKDSAKFPKEPWYPWLKFPWEEDGEEDNEED